MISRKNNASFVAGRHKGWIFKPALVLVAVVFASLTFATVLAPQSKLSAQAAVNHPYEQAKAYNAYWSFWWCMEQTDWKETISITELRRSDVFSGTNGNNNRFRSTYISAGDNGESHCHNDSNIQRIIRDINIADPLNFFATSIQRGPDSYTIYRLDGSEYRLNGDANMSDRNMALVRDRLAEIAREKFPGLNVTQTTTTPALQYFTVKSHFLAECVEADNITTAQGGTTVKIVNNDGTVEDKVFAISDSNDEDPVGYGIGGRAANDDWGGTRLECRDMTQLLNNYADEAAAAVAQWRENNPDAEAPGDSSSLIIQEEDNTCEGKSGAMGWILCPTINLLDGILNFVDTQIQRLLMIDENKYTNESLREAWQRIRNIAYIVLIPVMLVMVIGTAIGLEVFSAYTVKRALPRMVIAVIFITFSWYITTFMVGFFNTVGTGILGIVTQPFNDALPPSCDDTLTLACLFEVDNGSGGNVLRFILLSAVAPATVVGLIAFLGFFGGTLALAAGTAFIVLLARQIFIIALILVAPLAILAWIFPGNDKFWGAWWNLFTKLLMMFPLIMLILGVGRVFALLIHESGGGAADGNIVNPIMKLGAYILPYAFIPFAFKFAGGIFANLAGVVNDREKGVFDRLRQRRHNKWERGTGVTGRMNISKTGVLQGRSNAVRNLRNRSSGSNTRFGSAVFGGLASGIGGYNIVAQTSAQQAAANKEIGDIVSNGPDDAVRGLTALDSMARAKASNWDGSTTTADARLYEGRRQYKSLGGAWIDESYVNEGKARWGNDAFVQQAALSYEMRKAMKEEDVAGISERFAGLAKDQWKMKDNEASGAWIGAGFENQNQHLEFKNTSWKGDLYAKKFVDEAYEKKGTYQLSQMSSHTIKQLKNAYDIAESTGDVDTMEKVSSISENFMHEYSSGRIGGTDTEPEFDPTGAPTGRRQASSQGASHVAERVVELAKHVRKNPATGGGPSVYDSAPTGVYTAPDAARTGNRREQK